MRLPPLSAGHPSLWETLVGPAVTIWGSASCPRGVSFNPTDILRRGEGPERHPESDRTDFSLDPDALDPVEGPPRDGIQGLRDTLDDEAHPPRIVSVSDIHGYLNAGREALLALTEHPDLPPVVTQDDDGLLHWAGENYVLVFNGDLIDRGPANAETVEMAARLIDEAPTGRVRITFGNHEMAIMTPAVFGWTDTYSCQLGPTDRRDYLASVEQGHVVAAYEGYNCIYAHAGRPEPYEVTAVNDELLDAATHLDEFVGGDQDYEVQDLLLDEYPAVMGVGGVSGRGPGAGIAWLDFKHMPDDAPGQVVGHSRHDELTRKGTVLCENVIRNNLERVGGEAVTVETPDRLLGLTREKNGGVRETAFELTPPSNED